VKQAAKILDAEVQIASLEPRGLSEILENILLVGELTDTADRARAIVDDLQRRIDAST